MDTVLQGYISEFRTASDSLKSCIDAGDIAGAEKADQTASALKAKIDQRRAELARLDEFRVKSKDAMSMLDEPQFTVPVPGAKRDGTQQARSGASFDRLDSGMSEIEKLQDNGGFKNFGHFLYACRTGSALGGRPSEPDSVKAMQRWAEVQIKSPTGMFEGSDPDGGELVPRQYSNTVYQRIVNPNRLFGRLAPITVTGNSLEIPRLKENSRADGSRHGGVLGYWQGTKEAVQYTTSRPIFDNLLLRLKKLTVISYVTNELLADSVVALDSWLNKVVPDEFDFKINDALINGTGTNMPLGCLNSGSKITVTAVSGQGANTIVYTNVLKMHNRMLQSARANAVWLINQECEPQLEAMYLPTGTAHGNPVYIPSGGGASDAELARLKGKPVIPTEQCKALGTEGDIIFIDLSDMACIVKGAIESAMSMHLRFDYDEMAYKWSFRMDAQSYNTTALTPFNGSNTYSQIITLSSTRT